MPEVSLVRLYLLRAAYLLLVVGLGIEIWPGIIHHTRPWALMQGVVKCVLAAVSLLALIGVRYPLQMLPLLLFELVWKALWLGVVASPLWIRGTMDEDTWATAFACLMGAVFLFAVPWRYVLVVYVAQPGDRWA
jgi:hypothetical protein